MLGLAGRPLATIFQSNGTAKAGAKFNGTNVGVVYVVPLSLPNLSTQFIQYTTLATLKNLIRASLAILAPVFIGVATPAESMVYSFSSASLLCLTTNLLLAGVFVK